MNAFGDHILGKWAHSHEDDSGDTRVYRPSDYPFPPARGRAGMEFRGDGSFVEYSVGRADAPESSPGRWRAFDDRRVRVDLGGRTRVFEIVQCDGDILRIREGTD